jgi:hypothetical protein
MKITKRSDLHRAWARLLDMVENTGTAAYECVKIRGMQCTSYNIGFNDDPNVYEFAIAILEERPVFVGDVVYTINGDERKITGVNEYGSLESGSRTSSKNYLTWEAPNPKPTVTINGKTFLAPVITHEACTAWIVINETCFSFASRHERDAVGAELIKLLTPEISQ